MNLPGTSAPAQPKFQIGGRVRIIERGIEGVVTNCRFNKIGKTFIYTVYFKSYLCGRELRHPFDQTFPETDLSVFEIDANAEFPPEENSGQKSDHHSVQ